MTRRQGGLEREARLGSLIDPRPDPLLLLPPLASLDPLQTRRQGGEIMGLDIDSEGASPESMGRDPGAVHGAGAVGSGRGKGATSRVTVSRAAFPVD